MTRRDCLAALALPLAMRPSQQAQSRQRKRHVETVSGSVEASDLGTTLMHEHVLVDFVGADKVSPARYSADEAFRVALPHLRRVRSLGCRTLVECTPAWLGRDVGLLQRLAAASELNILTNTGYYGAANDKFLPPHAFTDSAEQLARRWVRDWKRGIDGTSIKPAFMKIGVDEGRLSDVDAKLVRAAAIVHRETGLTIHSHTTDAVAAHAQLDLLEEARVALSAFVWVHAQAAKDEADLVRAAERGAWIELDGVSEKTIDDHVELVRHLSSRGHLRRLLVSHDAGWYHVGEPGGGTFRPYDTLFTGFVPALRQRGFDAADIEALLVDNPRRVLT